ncbi:hypothetical protein Taro_013640 [Colocasia esculenta]|uniref:Uncharacterized protein n=1 Tax=Colocasia esculenta TaxID=4460 RepID=A0A843UCG1_COLES|nr:hypothetical protein [Colocasia esculenta]
MHGRLWEVDVQIDGHQLPVNDSDMAVYFPEIIAISDLETTAFPSISVLETSFQRILTGREEDAARLEKSDAGILPGRRGTPRNDIKKGFINIMVRGLKKGIKEVRCLLLKNIMILRPRTIYLQSMNVIWRISFFSGRFHWSSPNSGQRHSFSNVFRYLMTVDDHHGRMHAMHLSLHVYDLTGAPVRVYDVLRGLAMASRGRRSAQARDDEQRREDRVRAELELYRVLKMPVQTRLV